MTTRCMNHERERGHQVQDSMPESRLDDEVKRSQIMIQCSNVSFTAMVFVFQQYPEIYTDTRPVSRWCLLLHESVMSFYPSEWKENRNQSWRKHRSID